MKDLHIRNISQICSSINMTKSISLTFVGVMFSAKLDEDSKATYQQHLTVDECSEKQKAVFNKAINNLSVDWDDATFHDFKIVNIQIGCREDI